MPYTVCKHPTIKGKYALRKRDGTYHKQGGKVVAYGNNFKAGAAKQHIEGDEFVGKVGKAMKNRKDRW